MRQRIKAAPLLIPSKLGSASGLRNNPCIMAPDTAKARPTKMAINTRGRRIFSHICQSESVAEACHSAFNEKFMAPAFDAMRTKPPSANNKMIITKKWVFKATHWDFSNASRSCCMTLGVPKLKVSIPTSSTTKSALFFPAGVIDIPCKFHTFSIPPNDLTPS
ncbi:Uncharacterised protein [Providencia rettgeri]|uniref:Uncharacterized protein n=1 Tax=Providencia rettgeri TaxID=587 RepID=A0A379FPI2_PRORE|nr:Uncharacterised protein [Providencia rettgeri]